MEQTRYLIVGGGLAGGSAVEAIRARDQEGRIVLITDELHFPYDRVPLSKQYLMGKVPRQALFLQEPEFYEKGKVEVIRGRRVQGIKLNDRTAVIDDGRQLAFDRLLLATGGRPRRLPIPGNELPGIYYLRTIEDSEAIKAETVRARRAVVVGGGFIGCEVAAACRTKGLDTTIVELGSSLLNMALDPETAKWITEYFITQGVKVLTNTGAARFVEENGRVAGIETKTGERIQGDFVAVGVGIQPNVELAREAGLSVDNGIIVNERLEVDGTGVFAAGDVARFYSPLFEKHLRVEHYDVAVKHGQIAGVNMAGEQEAFKELPYFFSFMFKLQVQVWGDPIRRDVVVRRGPLQSPEKGGFAQFYLSQGRLQAYVSVNRNIKEAQAAQKLILARKNIEDASRLSDESIDLNTLLN